MSIIKNGKFVAKILFLMYSFRNLSFRYFSGFFSVFANFYSKSRDGPAVQKYKKINLKTMISLLLTGPKGCQGCQKIQKTNLKNTLVNWSTKIYPKLNRSQTKPSENRVFFANFCSILTVFTVSSIVAKSLSSIVPEYCDWIRIRDAGQPNTLVALV